MTDINDLRRQLLKSKAPDPPPKKPTLPPEQSSLFDGDGEALPWAAEPEEKKLQGGFDSRSFIDKIREREKTRVSTGAARTGSGRPLAALLTPTDWAIDSSGVRSITDGVVKFGKYNGEKVSDVANRKAGRGYLRWICENDFPQELKDICAAHLGDDYDYE